MKIPVRDVPQADSLDDVLRVVSAVGKGATTYQELSNVIDKTGRQGRYYRLAAEILGFIKPAGPNHSSLTPLGKELLKLNIENRKPLIANAIISSPLFQRVIPFLESKLPHGCTREGLECFIDNITASTTSGMIHRRASSIISWMQSIDMLEMKNDKYILRPLPYGINGIKYNDEKEPLLPEKFDLEEYEKTEQKFNNIGKVIHYFVEESKKERANESHRMLTNLVADKIRSAGAIPRSNQYIDLAARIRDTPYIFEMKSTTTKNIQQQIRRGLSQLYEYRYFQNSPDAQLVLVIENPLENRHKWLMQYLTDDRKIHLVWDGDRKTLHCAQPSNEKLRFLL